MAYRSPSAAPVDDYAVRHVRELKDEEPPSYQRGFRRLFAGLRHEDPPTLLTKLAEERRLPIVLVAPSGAGKTTEFRHLARKLRENQVEAAFVEASGLMERPDMDLDVHERAALNAMLTSQSQGVLFVDGLDELAPRARRIDQLLRRLEENVGSEAPRIRVAMNVRNGAWSPAIASQIQGFAARLGFKDIEVVTFEPLDPPAIAGLAEAERVPNLDEFMAEFDKEEIGDLFDLRPDDVKLLARLYRKPGDLGRWTELLQRYVEGSFVDERAEAERRPRLSIDAGRRGLERIAAATTLMGNPHVATPSAPVTDAAVSSRRLFSDWAPNDLLDLFDNPCLVHKGRRAEAVQLPQGAISDFLAARWLAERARNGLDAMALRDLLLVRPPGEARFEIPFARRAVVGWLASELPEFAKLVIADHPGVVAYEGDPTRLSDAAVREALRGICEQSAPVDWPTWVTPATASRLARASLELDVLNLIERHKDNPLALPALMMLVEHGRYRTCADRVFRLAVESNNSIVRASAIRAFAAADPGGRARLQAFASDGEEAVRAACVSALVPDHLHGAELMELVFKRGGCGRALDEVARRLATADLDAIIGHACSVMSIDRDGPVVKVALDASVPAVLARLDRSSPLAATLAELLVHIERHADRGASLILLKEEVRDLSRALERNDDARRAVWAFKLNRAAVNPSEIDFTAPLFGDLLVKDVGWLWAFVESSDSGIERAARFSLSRLWNRCSDDERESAFDTAHAPTLKRHLQTLNAERRRQSNERATIEREERRKDERLRTSNRQKLSKRLAQIESGDDLDALEWGWVQLEGKRAEFTRVSADRLRRYVGEDYAAAFLSGLRACWRKIDVPVPVPGEGRQHRYLVGLSGVALDAAGGLDMSALSQDQARRAARFGLYEINSFPFWYADLAQSHGNEVRAALEEVLSLEWRHRGPAQGVLRLAPTAAPGLREMLRELVLALLEQAAPADPSAVGPAIDAILTSTADTHRVIAVADRELKRALPSAPHPQWLRLWAHFEPDRAADWIESVMRAGAHAAIPEFLALATLLEQDLNARFGRTAATWLTSTASLGRWAKLLLSILKPEDDLRHADAFSPGPRDHAQDLRSRCLSLLASDPSPLAKTALLGLRDDPSLVGARPVIDHYLKQQRTAAVEAAANRWTEEDILRLERNDEKAPRVIEELFELLQAHLRHVGGLLENHDFSYRGLFIPTGKFKTQEREIQLWVASCLQQRARGLYTVVRENVVDDDKEVDVSAFAAGVGQVPVEIKPLGPYSPTQLEGVLERQLLGQYMRPRDRRYGILLLVRRDRRRWNLNGKRCDSLDRLAEHLQSRAGQLGIQHGKVIKVVVIDLLAGPRGEAASPPLSRRARATGSRIARSTRRKGGGTGP